MKKFTLISLMLIVSGLICCCLLCSCRKGENPTPESGKIKIAATIFPLADIVKNIGGDKVDVITIMPAGASPHTFEISPKIVEEAMDAKILFKIGANLDNWAEGVTGAMQEKPEVVDISKSIVLRKLPDGSVDPHYWLSVQNGMIIAKEAEKNLSALDPADRQYFSDNLNGYLKRLSKTNEELKKMFVNLPDKKFVTFHEAWFYFAHEYGLEVIAAFEPFPGKEPTPQFLAQFTSTIKENNVKVLFTEPQFSTEIVKQLAKDVGIRLKVLDPIGGTSAQTNSYINMMKSNADAIYDALRNQ
jgi:zinc transport system substrate-binding protein